MLRFRILASVVPLAVAAVLVRGDLFADARPCVAVADMSVQLTSLPWQSDLHVAFTNDPQRATVRVEITDSAAAADFTVIDDIDNADAGACPMGRPQRVSISASPSAFEPVIYLTRQGPADYRIFVQSNTFSVRDAAALIVGARGGLKRVQEASL